MASGVPFANCVICADRTYPCAHKFYRCRAGHRQYRCKRHAGLHWMVLDVGEDPHSREYHEDCSWFRFLWVVLARWRPWFNGVSEQDVEREPLSVNCR